MSRTKRVIVATSPTGTYDWTGRATSYADLQTDAASNYLVTHSADSTSVALPTQLALPGVGYVTNLTVWGLGIISFGDPTDAQIAFMAQSDGTNLDQFPGDYVLAGAPADPFGPISVRGLHYFDYHQVQTQSYGIGYYGEIDVSWAGGSVLLSSGGITINPSSAGEVTGVHLGPIIEMFSDGQAHSVALAPLTTMTGSDGADTLTGDAWAETISGGAGDDVIDGVDGADVLLGGDGVDQLTGHGDRDRLDGGAGADILIGGSLGEDLFTVSSEGDSVAGAADQIRGFQTRVDYLDLSALDVTSVDVEQVDASDWQVTATLRDGHVVVVDSDQLISTPDILLSAEVRGTDADDDLTNEPAGATIYGGLGEDVMSGSGSNTFLYRDPGESPFSSPSATDIIENFKTGRDTIDASAFTSSAVALRSGGTIVDIGGLEIRTTDPVAMGDLVVSLAQTGGSGADTLGYAGLRGHATLAGGAGNDTLIGTTGADVLDGGADNDVITGGGGHDTITGGTGDDTITATGGVIDAGGGNDTVTLDLSGEAQTLVGTANASGSLTLSGSLSQAVVASVTGAETMLVTLGSGDDLVDTHQSGVTIHGGAGQDWIANYALPYTGFGDAGDDVLHGAGGCKLDGGAGSDTYAFEGAGSVRIDLGAGTATSAGGTDTLTSIENARGGSGDDVLIAGAPTTVAGLSGATVNQPDLVVSGSTADPVSLMGAFDLAASNAIANATTIPHATVQGTWSGGDEMRFALDLSEPNTRVTAAVSAAGQFTGTIYVETDEFDQFGNYVTTLSSDTPSTTGSLTELFAGPASVPDGYTAETFLVLQNTDYGNADPSSFTLNISLTDAAVTYLPQLQGSTLTGMEGNDTLTGKAGSDTLDGGTGNDTLDGGAGADTMTGGAGNDTYIVDNPHDVVVESEGGGNDTIRTSVSWRLEAHVDNLTLTGSATVGKGNQDANHIIGDDLANSLYGYDGNDRLSGGAGADTMQGGAGDDTYFVDNAHDKVIEAAGAGIDLISTSVSWRLEDNVENLTLTGGATVGKGNALDNHLVGDALANSLYGYDGNDTLDGGAGADTMQGGAGNDTYVVDNAHDVVTESANAGTDTIETSVSWRLESNVENLTLTGTADLVGKGNGLDNHLVGNTGADSLYGLDGDDVIQGGLGRDLLSGGSGHNSFVFTSVADFASASGSKADEIIDWGTGDRIDLSAIDAKAGGKDDAFTWIGQSSFDHHAGELQLFIKAGTTYVFGDVDGDGKADFGLKLDGVHNLTAADFVL